MSTSPSRSKTAAAIAAEATQAAAVSDNRNGGQSTKLWTVNNTLAAIGTTATTTTKADYDPKYGNLI